MREKIRFIQESPMNDVNQVPPGPFEASVPLRAKSGSRFAQLTVRRHSDHHSTSHNVDKGLPQPPHDDDHGGG